MTRRTSVPIFRDTHQELKALKRGGQSFDELVSDMIEDYGGDR